MLLKNAAYVVFFCCLVFFGFREFRVFREGIGVTFFDFRISFFARKLRLGRFGIDY